MVLLEILGNFYLHNSSSIQHRSPTLKIKSYTGTTHNMLTTAFKEAICETSADLSTKLAV